MIRASLATLAFVVLAIPMVSTAAAKDGKTATATANAAKKGYEVSIEGMTCASCANSVTKALQNLPSVEKGSVRVVLSENKAYLEMAKQDVQLEKDIRAAVEKAGFKVASIGPIDSTIFAAATAKAETKAAPADKATCEDCGKEGHTCKECGAKGEAHSCKDGASCKEGCKECAKKGHKHGDHKHAEGDSHDHASH